VAGRLDEGRSYWVVTWSVFSETGDEHPGGRWVSYAQACKWLGSHLNFERFSSSIQMREELPTLLNVGECPSHGTDRSSAVSLHNEGRYRAYPNDERARYIERNDPDA
jgi:hypothetical protein